jgi:hypothetical protein
MIGHGHVIVGRNWHSIFLRPAVHRDLRRDSAVLPENQVIAAKLLPQFSQGNRFGAARKT